jgi:serine protease Do
MQQAMKSIVGRYIMAALLIGVFTGWAFTLSVVAQEKSPPPPAQPVDPAEQPAASSKPVAKADVKIDPVFRKTVPTSIDDLKKIEKRLEELVAKLQPCTVGLRLGRAQGSGVIVSKDGYVLTAAHVSSVPGRDVVVVLPDGRQVKGKSLGLNRGVDAGLVKITTDEEWPFADIADYKSLKVGDWCVAMGHPGGYKKGRAPVVRLGRIIIKRDTVVQSDCALVGGDSGGPLFDMQGRVIGIHSRIGPSIHWNFHVPIAAYSDGWDRMVKSEVWGARPARGGAILGVNGETHPKGAKVTGVPEGYPAHKAGLQVGDVITKLDGKPVKAFDLMAESIRKMRPGQKIKLEVLRGEEVIQVEVILGKRE